MKTFLSFAELHCPIAEFQNPIFNRFEEQLAKTVAKISFRRSVINTFAIPTGKEILETEKLSSLTSLL